MYTAHIDQFILNSLPLTQDSPEIIRTHIYERQFNIATKLLDDTASLYGPKICFYYDDHYWTYNDLLHKANQIALMLVDEYGFKPGNRLLIHSFNTPMQIACWFAGLKAGGICILTMPLLRAEELSHVIDEAKVNFFLCDHSLLSEEEQATKRVQPFLTALSFSALGDNNELIIDSQSNKKSGHFENTLTYADDPAIIAFTSGSTGKAKAVVHTHHDLLCVCDLFPTQILKLDHKDVCCGTPPLGFTFGLGASVLFPMRFGASTVLLKNNNLDVITSAVQRHFVSHFFSNPTMYLRLLNQIDCHAFASVKQCISAGEHLPQSTFNKWKKSTGKTLFNTIGSTEMLHIFMSSSPQSPYQGLGKIVHGYQAQIIDAKGNPVDFGLPGHLAVKGPTGCRYLNNPKAQKKYVQNGWNVTGDICIQKSDGTFWYQSRADEMIISSGYNISGYEVEEVLLEHSKIKECIVVGVDDPDRGQIVKAFIVLEHDIAGTHELIKEIQCFVKQKIAPFKYPRAIEFINELPKTNSGKIKRCGLINV